MDALIDGDILVYRIGFTTENEPDFIAKARTDDLIDSILMETGAKGFEIWLSDNSTNNFRYAVWSQYKANRKAPRPFHYELIKEHLVSKWGARFAHGMEADDALGIAQDQDGPLYGDHTGEFNTVICSIDKDLLQIPGLHYNFVKKEWQTVTDWEGIQWFYKQILIGDSSDNIRGCEGIGPVKAGKAIDKISSQEGEGALFEAVLKLYEKQEGVHATRQEILDHILLIGRLLKIKQSEDEELWHFPKSSVTVAAESLSTASTQEATIPSTEPTTVENSMGGSQLLGQPKDTSSTAIPRA